LTAVGALDESIKFCGEFRPRQAGGMPPAGFVSSAKPPSGRYLLFAEREEIALLRIPSGLAPAYQM